MDSEYVKMEAEVHKCPCCGGKMMYKGGNAFPIWGERNQDSQMKELEIEYVSSVTKEIDGDHEPICKKCADGDKGSFICAICKEDKPSSKSEDSRGYPAEHLCTDCFSSVSAKDWEKKLGELKKEHRYDFC